MAYIKTEWENEPSENTPLNASNLNKIENGIYNNSINIGDLEDLETTDKTNIVAAINEANQNGGSGIPTGGEFQFDGTTVPDGYEEIDDPYVYSTNEIKTNKKWINGKPIYRKCIANSSSATNGTQFSLNSILNMETLTNIISKEVRSTGAEIFGNYYDGSSNKFTLQYYANNNSINTWAGSETYTVTIFVEYTKTTD